MKDRPLQTQIVNLMTDDDVDEFYGFHCIRRWDGLWEAGRLDLGK